MYQLLVKHYQFDPMTFGSALRPTTYGFSTQEDRQEFTKRVEVFWWCNMEDAGDGWNKGGAWDVDAHEGPVTDVPDDDERL